MELESSILYGPVHSRRYGYDLGINLLPRSNKLCSFDCIYCQYGFSSPFQNKQFQFPRAEDVIKELQAFFKSQASLNLRHITISGNGEPAMNPHFAEIITRLAGWKKRNHPEIKITLLSTGYRIADPQFRKLLQLIDEPVMKLDSAIQEKVKQINRPLVPYDLNQFIEQLSQCSGITIQTMFIKDVNDGDEDIRHWINALQKIRPVAVQIYTISRKPPAPVFPVSNDELERIASVAESATNIPVHVFY